MRTKSWMGSLLVLLALVVGCASDRSVPPDEARAKYPAEDYSTPAGWKVAAEKHYPPAAFDYFEDMDAIGTADVQGARKLSLAPEEIKGRNAWVMWAAGNQAFWDWLARHGYGSIDLLKLIDSNDRGRRFARTGLMTEPGMRPPTEAETAAAHGIRYDRPVKEDPDPKKVHVEYRKTEREPTRTPPNYEVYGYPSGVVGLRLFKNPEFTPEAEARWVNEHKKDPDHYYKDSSYASRPDTIRPFRVGMSCGFCHIAPHPLNPPANPEYPEWENLSNNIGNQYLRFRASFGNQLKPDNYLYHVLDAQLPGALDTSLIPSDNLNNPNTINPFFGLPGRLERAEHNPRETIGADSLAYLRTYVDKEFESPANVPRVLLDGSDSVGVHIALSRVYLNIGTHHQQWIRLHNPLLGFRKQQPFKLRDVAENSLYWHATLIRINPLAAFFKASTDPMRLKDAPLSAAQRKDQLKGDGVPWYTDPNAKDDAVPSADYRKGRSVFARGCIACHSSVQPGDLPALEAKITVAGLPADRSVLGLRLEDLARLTRGDGTLPPTYAQWAQEAVKHREFWEHKDSRTGKVVHNFLSIDMRIPVTLTRTNSARAAATNGMHGHLWEDFASQTYKELNAVGPISFRDPFSGSEKSYETPSGGPGYYRVPTLISIWATAPFLHNNALGTFNNDPSVKGRLAAFDDAISKLLWPEKRRTPSQQWVWDVGREPTNVYDGWFEGARNPDQAGQKSPAEKAAARLDADGGWIWRTTQESSLLFEGHDIPVFLAGITGWSPWFLALVPWLPSLALVLLGVLLLLSGSIISFRERLEKKLPFLGGLFTTIRWVVALGAFVLAGFAVYFVWEQWMVIEVLDLATRSNMSSLAWIPWLPIQAILLPVVLFGAVGVLFSLSRIPAGGFRRRIAQVVGALCLVVAVLVALGFGRFLSGQGTGIQFGPIPEGVPVNVLANMDPNASFAKRKAVVDALFAFVLEYHQAEPSKRPGRKEFEERVAPVLMNASKCPDFVTDRGHDYEFMRRFTDDEKKALIELLKTF
jgi:hypothetical protein